MTASACFLRLLSALTILAPALPAAADPGAEAAGRAFYTPPFDAERESDRFTGAARETLERHEAEAAGGDIGCLDFSFVIDGQDFVDTEVTETLTLASTPTGDDAVEVTARFSNFGQAQAIVWTVTETPAGWKIADVASPAGGWHLAEICR